MQVNDLIFKELLKRGYSLDGKTRVWNIADSKLWYLTPEQSQAYLDLESDSSYKSNTGQPQAKDLIKENIRDIIKMIGNDPVNIIDLGCGDGIKACALIEEMKKLKPKLKIRYCPIDISGYMVEQALKTFSKLKLGESIEFKYNISDFENLENVTPLLRNGVYKKNLLLLLGNTLGNFEINDLLYSIKSAMKQGDMFLLDTAVDDNHNEERAEAYKNNKRVNEWLIHIPRSIGLSDKDVELGVRFKNSRIEAYYTLKSDKLVKFQDKSAYFSKGDQIIVVVAYKHDEDDLHSFLNLHFTEVYMKVSKDHGKAFALCSL